MHPQGGKRQQCEQQNPVERELEGQKVSAVKKMKNWCLHHEMLVHDTVRSLKGRNYSRNMR